MRERLSNAQHRFLRQIESEWVDDEQAQTRLANVEPLVLARWMASPPFKRRLEKTLAALRQRRELAVTFAAARASERLCLALESGQRVESAAVRSCLELVKLVRMREQNPLAEGPSDRQLREARRQERMYRELLDEETSSARQGELLAALERLSKQEEK